MKKKTLTFLLAAAMAASALAGCSGGGSTSSGASSGAPAASGSGSAAADAGDVTISAKGVLPIVDKPIAFSVFMAQDGTVTDYNDNKLTKFMEEQTGIHIDWQLVPTADKNQKMNLLLSSGETLPDIFMGGMDNALLVDYAAQGVFVPINQYMETQSAYYKDIMDQFDGLEEIMTAPDGNMYSMQNITDSIPNSYPIRAWINQDWLDKLNLPMPVTTEDFINVLTAFKTKDPNGNGAADEIPCMGATNGWHTQFDEFAINSFIQYNIDNPYIVDESGKVTAVYATGQYREGLKFLKSLVDGGLYDPVSFTQDINQLKQQFETEETAIVGVVPGGGPNTFANMSGERYRSYQALPPLQSPDGYRGADHESYTYVMYPNTFVITKNCAYPEAAFKWADYLYDHDVSMRARLGEPGTDWKEAEQGQLDVNGEQALFTPILLWGNQQNSHWAAYNPYLENFADKGVRSDDPFELQRYLWEATQNSYQPYTPKTSSYPPIKLDADNSKRVNEITTTLKDFINESRVQFATSAMDPNSDDDWNAYIGELQKIGYEEVVTIYQARYDELFK